MAVHVLGVAAMVVFYLLILAVGLWAARKAQRAGHNQTTDDVMLAGRSIGRILGPVTMTATWVGGGYINGSAEMVARSGLVKCQAPIGYSLSLLVGGLFFAKKMRAAGYVTMLDPFQLRYGYKVGGLMFIPALLGELFYTAAIMAALGATLSVILELDMKISIVVSAAISVAYTLFGGLYSVAITDVVQLLCLFFGLWISFPFALTHEAVGDITVNATQTWLGKLETWEVGEYVDTYLLLLFGGVPWQSAFQRVLGSKTPADAQFMAMLATLGCFIVVTPSIIIGAITASADWNRTSYPGPVPIPDDQLSNALPLTLQYLCPPMVTFLGLGAVSAAVMSSVDSSVLSAASMFSRNIYKAIFRPKASEREILWVTRAAIIVAGALSTAIAICVVSIYQLFQLCSDLVYVVLFPQLVCVVYLHKANSYGSVAGFVIGLLFRIGGGEPAVAIPPFIDYTVGVGDSRALLPFKTFAMLLSLSTIIGVSLATDHCFKHGLISRRYDFLKCMESDVMPTVTMKEMNTRVTFSAQTQAGDAGCSSQPLQPLATEPSASAALAQPGATPTMTDWESNAPFLVYDGETNEHDHNMQT